MILAETFPYFFVLGDLIHLLYSVPSDAASRRSHMARILYTHCFGNLPFFDPVGIDFDSDSRSRICSNCEVTTQKNLLARLSSSRPGSGQVCDCASLGGMADPEAVLLVRLLCFPTPSSSLL